MNIMLHPIEYASNPDNPGCLSKIPASHTLERTQSDILVVYSGATIQIIVFFRKLEEIDSHHHT